MSKDTPEVGDVWKKGNYLYHITNVEKYEFSVGATISYINNNLITNFKDLESFQRCFTYIGKSKANIDDLFKTEEEEEWTPLSELGCNGIDFDLIPSNEFLECVKVQGFVDDDGDGSPVIKADDGTFLYNKKKSVYPSEIQNKDKLDFDYVAWFNK